MSREVSKTRFEGAAPILSVKDMSASVRYYVNVLGFRNADWGTEDFTSVSRDGAGIYLCRGREDRKSTRLNSSHSQISYAVFCLKKKKHNATTRVSRTQLSYYTSHPHATLKN